MHHSIDIISKGHAPEAKLTPRRLVMPSTASPSTARWLVLPEGQTSSSPDCSSAAPTTPSRSLTGTFYEPAIEDCPAPLTFALLSLPPT